MIEIALEAGYGSQQAFMQAFHQEYECTPQEYRKKGLFAPKQNRIVLQEENGNRFMRCFTHLSGGEMAA